MGIFSRTPFVLTCYGTDVLRDLPASTGIERAVLGAALRKASAITCDSGAVAKTLVETVPGVEARTIKTILWGVDTDLFTPASNAEKKILRARYAIPAKAVVLLSIRTLSPHYRIAEIIERFSDSVRGEEFRLFVHVNEYSDPLYVDKCRTIALRDPRVIFHDWEQDPAIIPSYYRLSDCSLHYPVSDAMPVSMLEALASGHLVFCDPAMPAYAEAGKKYQLCLKNLENLSSGLITREISAREDRAARNREIVVSTDSAAASSQQLRSLLCEVEAGAYTSQIDIVYN